MEHTENVNKAAGAPSALNAGLGRFPTERTHIKTEIWWLIERDSPAQYVSGLAESLQITSDAWNALKFPTKEIAEEMLHKSCYGKCSDWRILDHMFYVWPNYKIEATANGERQKGTEP